MRRDLGLIRGYSGLFGQIATCLSLKKLPSQKSIENSILDWSVERRFLDHGGTVGYALEYLLAASEDIERAYSKSDKDFFIYRRVSLEKLPR
jgi:hypothetical protein